MGEDEARTTFDDLYKNDTQEQVTNHMCDIGDVQRGSYFGGEPDRKTEMDLRVRKFRNGKDARKDEVIGKMVRDEGSGEV